MKKNISPVSLCLLLFASAFAALSLSACSGMGSYRDKLDVGGREYQYEGNTVRYTVPDVTIEMSYLSQDSLDLYFSLLKGGRYKNPFPPGPYIVLSMTIENNSKKRLLTYDPRRTELYPPKGDPTFALDYASLYTDFEIYKFDDVEERMEVFRETSLDSSLALEPGGKAQGLVVFSRPKEMNEGAGGQVVVVADRVYLDHEPSRVPFVFKEGMPSGIEEKSEP